LSAKRQKKEKVAWVQEKKKGKRHGRKRGKKGSGVSAKGKKKR